MIDYLSASQINCFIEEPALWIVQYVRGIKGEAGPAAYRGLALEAAVDYILFKQPATEEELVKIALQRFELDAGGEISDAADKQREEIPEYLTNLIPFLQQQDWGLPVRQVKIETWIDDVRLTGYIDYKWPDWLLDLKTTGKMPSFRDGILVGKDGHIRQMAIYREATGTAPTLLYATPGKAKEPVLYRPSDHELDVGMRQIRAAIRAIKRIDEGNIEMFPPRDLTSYMWSDVTREAASKIWRL
jgi:hypothetical protein